MEEEKLTMWQLIIFGSTITTAYLKDALSLIQDESEELADGEHVKITKVLMTQEQYEALPEFEGY